MDEQRLRKLAGILTEAKIELNPDDVLGIINYELLPGHGDVESWEPMSETILLASDVNPRKAAKEFIHMLQTQSEWERDLEGADKYAKINPWAKWNDDAIETSAFFDPWVGDLAAQKREFKKFKRQLEIFIMEVKKLLGVR